MKKMNFFAVLITIVMACVAMVSCSEDYSDNNCVPPQKEEPQPDPNTPTPEEPDTTKWSWNGLIRSDLTFDTTTEMVSAYNIGQISNAVRTVFDSIPLVYRLGVDVAAPTRVVVFQKDTTVASIARTNENRSYGEYIVSDKDSVYSVTTGHSFPTQYYDISATTTSKRGFSLHAGHWEPFKYVTEKAQWNNIYHEPLYEVESNDSIFNREIVHNLLTFVIISNKGQRWSVSREKVVVVDHFLRMKEKAEEQKPEEETAEFDIPDYIGVQAYVRSYDVIKKRWNDAILIDSKEAYYIVSIPFTYNKEKDKEQVVFTSNGKVEKHIQKWLKAEVGETKDYNSVLNYQGTFYPAAMSVDAYGWYCVFNMTIDQSIDMNQATISGLKNQPKNGNAKGDPRVEHVVSKSASGQVVTITGKTIGHTISTTLKIK